MKQREKYPWIYVVLFLLVFMLRKQVGSSMVQDRTVRIPAELVAWAIKALPRRIQIYDRRGDPQFSIGGEGDHTRFGIGVTALYYQEPETDTPVLFQRRHMQDMVRLGNKLRYYDMVSTVGIVRDVPEHLTDLYGSLEHFANGIKPLVLLCSDEKKFDDVMQMFEVLHGGDLGEKPFILPYFNPVSPLVMNEGTVDKMRTAIERGLPASLLRTSSGRLGSCWRVGRVSARRAQRWWMKRRGGMPAGGSPRRWRISCMAARFGYICTGREKSRSIRVSRTRCWSRVKPPSLRVKSEQ